MASGTDSAQLVLPAEGGGLFYAPVGTALPNTATEALDGAFVGLGFVSEDGAEWTPDPDIEEVYAWGAQSRFPVARRKKREPINLKAALLQWNPDTFAVVFAGTNPGGGFDPDTSATVTYYSYVLEFQSNSYNNRLVIGKGNAVPDGGTKMGSSGAVELPLRVDVFTQDEVTLPYYWRFEDPVWA